MHLIFAKIWRTGKQQEQGERRNPNDE